MAAAGTDLPRGAGGGGGVGSGGGGGAVDYSISNSCTQGGFGGFGGGGGGSGGSVCYVQPARSVYGGGPGGVGGGDTGAGGNGLGGAIFNQLGSVYLYSVTFSGNSALGGAGGTNYFSFGEGGAVFNLDGVVWMTDVTTSSDRAVNGLGKGGQGSEVYVTSDPGGLTSASQTPTAILRLVGTSLPAGSAVVKQVSGTAIEYSDSAPVGQSGSQFTVTIPISRSGTVDSALVQTGGEANLDFTLAGNGTCVTAAAPFTAGQTCTVPINFTASAPGLRTGAVVLVDSSLNELGRAFLSATGQAPQIAFTPGTPLSIAGDWEDGVAATAVNSVGTLYVAEVYDGKIDLITKSANTYSAPSVLVSGLGMPISIAVDGAGDVFYADWLYSAVYELPFNGISYETVVSLGNDVGWSSPNSVAVDAQGDLFVTDLDLNEVVELPWTGTGFGPAIALPNYNFNWMANVAADPAGNVYVTDNGNNQVVEFPNMGTEFGNPVVTTINTPSLWGIATDAMGNVYLSDSSTGAIMSMLAQPGLGFSTPTTVATGLNTPLGMAVDQNGNIVVAPGGGAQLVKIDRFDPPTINFPTPTLVGATDTTDGAENVTVTNIGNMPLVFSTPIVSTNPRYSANFPVAPGATGLCAPGSLQPNSSCAVSAVFAPQQVGANQGTIVLIDNALNGVNAANSTQSILLTGTAIGRMNQTITFASIPSQVVGATINLTASASSGVAVAFKSTTPTVCTVSGATSTMIATGTCSIDVTQAGNAYYFAAPAVGTSFVVRAVQTITFPAITSSEYVGSKLTLSATSTSGLTVTFSSITPSVCSVSGVTATMLTNGTCTIQAAQSGNATYGAATPVRQSFVVIATLTISFPAITATEYAASTLALSATATSGLAVSFSSTTPTVCTVSGATASLLIGGKCTLQASQAGNGNYSAVTPVTQSFTVTKASQTITFSSIPIQPLGATINLTASASSGLPVAFKSTTAAVCTVSGSTATMIAIGTCSIDVTQAGNTAYNAAPAVGTSFVVRAAQTITFPTLPTPYTVGLKLTLSATSTSSLAVTYTSTTTSVCSLSGSTVTLLAGGSCSLVATQAGNATYAAATPVTHTFTISSKLSQTVTFASIPTQPLGATINLVASASSGLRATFKGTTLSICIISGSTATMIATGTCSIDFLQTGNATYLGAPAVGTSFVVRLAQTITFPTITGTEVAGTKLTLSASSTSGLGVAFTSTTPAVCTVSGTSASLLTAGTCSISAAQAGNATYAAAAPVAQSFTVIAN